MWLSLLTPAQPLQCPNNSCRQLESDSQSQTNGPLAEHAFLLEAICQLTKQRIMVNDSRAVHNRQYRSGVWIDFDVKVAQLCECAPTAPEIGIRRQQGVIEDIVEISPEGRNHTLSDLEALVNT